MEGINDDVRMIVKNVGREENAEVTIKYAGKDYTFVAGIDVEVPWLAGDHAISKRPDILRNVDEFKRPQTLGGPKLNIKIMENKVHVGSARIEPIKEEEKKEEESKVESEPIPEGEPVKEEVKEAEETKEQEEPKPEPKIKLPRNFDEYNIKELRKFAKKYGVKAKDTDTEELRAQIKKELGY